MKYLFPIFLIISLQGFSQTTYRIDPSASTCTWTGYAEIGGWAPSGTLTLEEGTFQWDGQKLGNAKVVFNMKTISHEIGKLQKHLRGATFFDVKQHPQAIFTTDKTSPPSVTGALTLKDQTRVQVIELTVNQTQDQIVLTGEATVDRTKFGITYNSTSFSYIGDEAIKNEFTLTFRLVAQAES